MQPINKKIICAGYGGQGIMVLGKFCATAAMLAGFEVSFIPSYGAEVRGGSAHGMIRICSSKIGSAFFAQSDAAIIMNQPSLNRFLPRLREDGTLVVNSSLAKDPGNDNLRTRSVPATEIAKKLGNVKIANMICAGAYSALQDIISYDAWKEAIRSIFLPRGEALYQLCLEGFNIGREKKGDKK